MKRIVILVCILCSHVVVRAQVKEISKYYENRPAFVENVDLGKRILLVNFVEDESIRQDVLNIKDNTVILLDGKKKGTLDDIRSNDELSVTYERFEEGGYSDAVTIQIIDNTQKLKDITGRIDAIESDIAYVDGNRIRLAPGTVIQGRKKSEYGNKALSSLTALKLGDMAELKGSYTPGVFEVSRFLLSPDNRTQYDKIADTIDGKEYDRIAPLWNDPEQRKTLFGTEIPGIGTILDNEAVQAYVNAVGQKLVPDHIKAKKQFVFVVVNNPDVNANVRPNGLAFVYTGLLKVLKNEAQLAAVLGHEIAHAIYEHSSKQLHDEERAKKNDGIVKQTGNAIAGLLGKSDKQKRQEAAERAKEERATAAGKAPEEKADVNALAHAYFLKRVSDYSVDDEYQADRVGVRLMVGAGYDPRQAPLVWKTLYNTYGLLKEESVSFGKALVEKFTEEPDDNNTLLQQGGITGITAKTFMTWKTADFRSKSFRTHPSKLQRFRKLNNLISMYWNEPRFTSNAISGDKEYRAMLRAFRNPKKAESAGKAATPAPAKTTKTAKKKTKR